MAKKYRKKPVVIEAVQWDGFNRNEIAEFCPAALWGNDGNGDWALYILTLEGEYIAIPGDFIVKGVAGEFYPCKEDIFNLTYEEINGHGDDE